MKINKTTNKKSLQPKLRFREFRDDGDWEEKELNKLGSLVSGLTYSPDDVQESGLLVLRSSNIQNGAISLEDKVYVTPDIKGVNLSQPNDILICVRNGSKSLIGKNALIPEGLSICTHGAFMTVFRSKSWKFVFQLFQTKAYQKQVDGDLGATINSINGSHLMKYKFVVPSPEEQQKIADCLSSLDELIEAEDQKLEALQRHKKGLMQELFPSEGQTLPKRRFPEFQSSPEWEEKTLAELGRFIGGGTPSKSVAEYWQGEFPWISSSDLSENDIHNVSITKFITNEAIKESATKVVPKGSVLFVSRVGVGKLAINNQDLCTSQDFTSFVLKETCNYYLAYYFLAKKELLIGLGQGTSIKGFSKNDIEDFKINIPSQKEQQRIADFLSSIDDLITAQTKKLESLRLHKKGLMQQLFPNHNQE